MKPRLLIKIGSASLTQGTNAIKYSILESLAMQMAVLAHDRSLILVSSGAIAHARYRLGLERDQNAPMGHKQALASIGQPHLMRLYHDVFGSQGLSVAQCLLTAHDLVDDRHKANITSTFEHLWEMQHIPVVNENDTVATTEIRFGDNDTLAAHLACAIKADRVIIISDIDGVYDANPKTNPNARLIPHIVDAQAMLDTVDTTTSSLGTGGIVSKLNAGLLCQNAGIPMSIVNIAYENCLIRDLAGTIPSTHFF